MFYTKASFVVAGVFIFGGVVSITTGLLVLNDPSSRGVFFSESRSTGAQIDRGFIYLACGAFFGFVAEISKALHKLVASQETKG